MLREPAEDQPILGIRRVHERSSTQKADPLFSTTYWMLRWWPVATYVPAFTGLLGDHGLVASVNNVRCPISSLMHEPTCRKGWWIASSRAMMS